SARHRAVHPNRERRSHGADRTAADPTDRHAPRGRRKPSRQEMSASPRPPGRLYLVPNLLGIVPPEAVLPQRTIEVARRLRHFVVETPKVARQFLKSLGSDHPLQALQLSELNEHTPPECVEMLLEPAIAGEDLGLLSDAGCPGVADPGAALVAAAHRAGAGV